MHLEGYIVIGLVGAAAVGAILTKLRITIRASKRSGLTEQQFEQNLAAKGVPRGSGASSVRRVPQMGHRD